MSERGDQRAGAFDAGGGEDLVVGDVAEHGRVLDVLQPGAVAVDDHDLVSGADEVVGARHTDAAPAADDGVTGHPADRFVHPSPFQVLAQVSLDQRLEQDAERVQRGPDAGQDGQAATAGRFGHGDLAAIVAHQAGDPDTTTHTEPARASEHNSLAQGTGSWARLGEQEAN